MTKRNSPRFTDSKDFDDVHDTIMADIIANPLMYVEKTLLDFAVDDRSSSLRGTAILNNQIRIKIPDTSQINGINELSASGKQSPKINLKSTENKNNKPMTKWIDEEWSNAIPKKIRDNPDEFIAEIKNAKLKPLIDLYFSGVKIDHRRNKDDRREYLLEPRSPYILFQLWKASGGK